MSAKRILSGSALALGLMASNVVVFADAASAQERPQYGQHRGAKPAAAPAAKPAARAAAPSPHFARPAHPQIRQGAPSPGRYVAPPVVRHAAPAPERHREAPRRGYGWRPWGYGAAAVGAVIVGSRFARASRSDLQRCADRYDSFDWDTGTIENEDGDREICPYLE